MATMYFLTTVQTRENKIIDTRCVGYFDTYEEALFVVLENSCDIHEGIYDYAVIETIPSGLYRYSLNSHWFRFSEDKTRLYEEIIIAPDFAKNVTGFAIG